MKGFTLMSKALKGNKGFTLIELLIAIAIIGLVFGVVITSSNAIQRQSRDTQRQSDLKVIQAALEQYHADAGVYPPSVTAGGTITCTSPTCATSKTYLSLVPKDPQSGTYNYVPYTSSNATGCDNGLGGNCVKYCMYAKLELVPNPQQAAQSPCAVNPPTNNIFVASP